MRLGVDRFGVHYVHRFHLHRGTGAAVERWGFKG